VGVFLRAWEWLGLDKLGCEQETLTARWCTKGGFRIDLLSGIPCPL
jgi:hypothetical protein